MAELVFFWIQKVVLKEEFVVLTWFEDNLHLQIYKSVALAPWLFFIKLVAAAGYGYFLHIDSELENKLDLVGEGPSRRKTDQEIISN